MKTKRNINFTGLFLFLIYIFGNSPTIMFHHHDNTVSVSYNKEDNCEIAIYSLDKENYCEHQQHISNTFKKCSLCDNHTLSAHTIFSTALIYPERTVTYEYKPYANSFHSILSPQPTNRGPPTV